jgi:hypothetical protein
MILLLATYRLLGLYILCGLSLMHDIFVVFFQGNTKMNLVIQDLIVKVKKKIIIWLHELIQMKS